MGGAPIKQFLVFGAGIISKDVEAWLIPTPFTGVVLSQNASVA